MVGALPGGVSLLLDLLQFALVAAGMAALFRYVPNTDVRWGHAWAGGLFVAVGARAGQEGAGLYLGTVPTYSVVYGAFATVPILLLWIYVAWVIVLLGAVIAAYLPSLLAGVARRGGTPGWRFQLALEASGQLHAARATPAKGLTWRIWRAISGGPAATGAGHRHLAGPGLGGPAGRSGERDVLLADPEEPALAPLVERLAAADDPSVEGFMKNSQIPALNGRQTATNAWSKPDARSDGHGHQSVRNGALRNPLKRARPPRIGTALSR